MSDSNIIDMFLAADGMATRKRRANVEDGGDPPMPPTDYYTKAEMDAKLEALGARVDAKIDARANELKLEIQASKQELYLEIQTIKLDIRDVLKPIGERLAAVERMNVIVTGTILTAGILGALKYLWP